MVITSRIASRPKPTIIARPDRIKDAWDNSPDSKGAGRAPGIDGILPTAFSRELWKNVEALSDRIKKGVFEYSKLRFHPIPKSEDKYRILCIPTVEDRLVQRLVLRHLLSKDKTKTLNSVSYGFISGNEKSVSSAQRAVLNLRNQYRYCVKTDIVEFFDRVDRKLLLDKFSSKIRRSSIFPLIEGAVHMEISQQRNKFEGLSLYLRTPKAW
jgi:retron-type reverse transcriptase